MKKKTKIMVLGSNSFSGASFINHVLDLDTDVVGISRSEEPNAVFLPYKWQKKRTGRFSFMQYDLNRDLDRVKTVFNDFKPDYVVNFAAQGMVSQSWGNPDQWFMTNTVAGVNLIQAFKDASFLKKFVQISTPEVYGSCEGFVKENMNYAPSTPYAVSKAAADMSLSAYFREFGFPVVFIRSANVYGPGQLLYRIIPKALIFFLLGKSIELHGGGKSIRSFIHIDDVSEGIVKALFKGGIGEIYHFSTPEAVSIRTLVEKIAEKTEVSFLEHIIETQDRPGKDKAYLLDCKKAETELGWKSSISIDKGIDVTFRWIRENLTRLKKESFDYIHKQ